MTSNVIGEHMFAEFYSTWIAVIISWTDAHPALAMLIVFMFAFAESVVLLAILVPSTLIFAGIGAIYATAGDTLLLLWLAGSLGALCGDAFSFGLGRIFKDDVQSYWPFRDRPEVLTYSRAVFREWGWFALIASKFAFGIRPFIPLTAGILAMPTRVFLLASGVAGIVWAGVMLGTGFVLARALLVLF
ncbi:MAG: DedA family protein [Pseudomonadota bacterium]